jgi:serine protease
MAASCGRFKSIPVFLIWAFVFLLFGCDGGRSAPAGQRPRAVFTATPEIGSMPLEVTFDAIASSDSDGTITGYNWSFGDGVIGSGAIANHTYSVAGQYTVTLTVTDNGGMTGTGTRSISVLGVFSIRGTIAAPAHTAVDSDLNDPYAPYGSNNSFTLAQPILSPATLGGYANVAGTGSFGRTYGSGDEDDFFYVALTAGMQLALYIGDVSSDADLDLYLYDENQVLVDAAIGTSTVESLTASSTGHFFLRVHAFAGASNYALTIGQAAADDAGAGLRLSDDFVPGEAVVRFRREMSAGGTFVSSTADLVVSTGLQAKAGSPDQELLMSFAHASRRESAFKGLGIDPSGVTGVFGSGIIPEKQRKLETLLIVKALQKRFDIQAASPNFIRKPLMVPDDPFFPLQWHYSQINLPQAWELTTGRTDVIVAVVDTGVLMDHPDLQGQLVNGYDFIVSPDISLDGDGMDPDPDDPGDEGPSGSSFHGTHVAGTIAAATNNAIGAAGVAGQARIMPLRALGKGGGTLFDILTAVRFAAGIENASGVLPDRRADIINLSLGGSSPGPLEESVYQQVRDAGVIVVAAAGNEAAGASLYPAAYDTVVSVSAVAIDGTLAPYSNYGPVIAVAAPGGDLSRDLNGDGRGDGVLSTAGEDSAGTIRNVYSFYQGTSMATPHVAGVAALMKSLYPSLTPNAFDTLLTSGRITQDLGAAGRDDQFGHGLIDALKSVQEAQRLAGGNGELPAALVVNPRALNFGSALTRLDLSVRNGGGGTLRVTAVTDDADWLTVTPSDTVEGLGRYVVAVDRSGLTGGLYSTTITFESTVNRVTVSVVMQSISFSGTGTTGYQYILLLDPETLETVQQVNAGVAAGFYPFEFQNVSYGKYLIYAGSDANNDGIICDSGEACGAYIALDQPTELDVTTDLTEINFGTDYNIDLPTGLSGLLINDIRPLRRLMGKQVVKSKSELTDSKRISIKRNNHDGYAERKAGAAHN